MAAFGLDAAALPTTTTPDPDPTPIRLAPPGIQPAFATMDSKHGLPSSNVLEVVSDRHGFLWIAGDRGVQRFDGRNFFHLDRDPDRPDSLESRFIYALAPCKDAMWIGHPNGSLQRLDFLTGKLQLVPLRLKGVSPQGMSWIACDVHGRLWQMSDLGLVRLDVRGNTTWVMPRSFDGFAFSPDGARLFVATADRRVVSIDVRNPGRIETVLTFPEATEPIVAIASDGDGLWLGVDRDLWRFDNARHALHRMQMPAPLFRTTYIKQSQDGVLWLGSWLDDGLYRFDPRMRLLSVFRHDPDDPQSIPAGFTTAMNVDRSNNLWLSKGEQGLTRLSLGQPALTRYRPEPGSTICGMAETTQGRLVAAVCRGDPKEFNRSSGRLEALPAFGDSPTFPRAIVSDRKGGLWIASVHQGLIHWQPKGPTRNWMLPRTKGPDRPSATGVCLDDRDRVWISHQLGLALLDQRTSELRNVQAFEGERPFQFDFTQDVSPGPNGTLWMATMKGLLSYDTTTRQIQRFQHDPADRRSLSDDYLLQTYTDREGRLWIATRAGLNRLVRDPRGHVRFRRYGVADGLPDITIEAVVNDGLGGLWAATARGIARWDAAHDRFRSYLAADGIPDADINPKSAFASSDGGLYFGSRDGLLRIDPRTIHIADPAPVVLSSYESGDASTVNLQGAGLSRIATQYTDGRLVAHIAVLGDARRLSYRLEGLDDRWQDMPADLGIAYHWLPPGSYRLQVRQLQRNGTWGDAALTLPVVVAPPWWRTTWAYMLYALLGAGLIVAAARAFMAWRHRALREQLKESHARLSIALNAAHFGMWAWDVHDDKAELDTFSRKLLDVSAHDPTVADLYRQIHPEDVGRIRTQFDQALREKAPVDFEFRLAHRDAEDMRWIEGHAVPYERPGKAAYVIGVNRDASQRKRELKELEEARSTAEHAAGEARSATEAKSRFLAMMSHEIRTPINGVIGMVDLLSDSPMNDEQRRQLGICRDSATLLLAIINDILDFSKIEAGKMTLEEAPFSPRRLVESVAESLAPQAARKGLDLDVYVDPDVPRRLIGDRVRLRQIVTNLLGNALKFTERGSVRVDVRNAGNAVGNRHLIGFDVVDTGIGMDVRTIEDLFQPFQQADATTTRCYGGTGLGLTIVRHLVDLMAGSIECDSVPGSGSRFTITISLEAVHAEGQAPSGLPPLDLLAVSTPGQRTTLLQELACRLDIDIACVHSVDDLLHAASPRLRRVEYPRVIVLDRGFEAEADRVRAASPGATILSIAASPLTSASLAEEIRVALGIANATVLPASTSASLPKAPAAKAEILIVDDNALNREVLSRHLERMGQACDEAEDGEQAWTLLQANHARYRLLLTDCHMPQLDGYSLTQRIREDEAASGRARLNVVAVTANALQGEGEHCLALGMDDFLTKPVRLEALHRLLCRIVPDLVTPAVLAKIVGDNVAALHRLLDIFVSETGADLERWKAACRERDRERLQQLAHRIKSSCRVVGEDEVSVSLEAVESHGGTIGDLVVLAMRTQEELERSVARVTAFRENDRRH